MAFLPTIIDVSHHQGTIDWNTVKPNIHFAIIRAQDGKSTLDRQLSRNISECENLGIPYYIYGYYRGGGAAEATMMVNRCAGATNVRGYCIDIEQSGYSKTGIDAYMAALPDLNNGRYTSHNLVGEYGTGAGTAWVWLPRYGANTGQPSTRPSYACDLWQFTSVGTVPGISGNVDCNACMDKGLDFFLGKTTPDLPDNLKCFSDLNGDEWYIEGLSSAVADGIISGYPNGTIGANDTCNRAQAVIMVLRAHGDDFSNPPFDDVYAEPYYYDAVTYAKEHGIVSGYDGDFHPTDPATREQVCVMLYNAFASGESVTVTVDGCSSWAADGVSWAAQHGIIGAGVDVRPLDAATRAEVAIMCDRAKNL